MIESTFGVSLEFFILLVLLIAVIVVQWIWISLLDALVQALHCIDQPCKA